MFWKIREAVGRFMYGRYGFDKFTLALLIISLAVNAVRSTVWLISQSLTADVALWVISLAVLGYAVMRTLSRNIGKRQAELARYTSVSSTIGKRIKVVFKNCTDRQKKYMLCPVCKAVIRFPRKKGVHPANCPKCKALITVKIR